jgi:hypothetical protein
MGIGLAGIGAGSYFGIRALNEQQTADGACPQDDRCTREGSNANADAIKFANMATVGFGVGVLGIGLGTFLLLSRGTTTVPSNAASTRWVAPRAVGFDVGGQGVTVRGAW